MLDYQFVTVQLAVGGAIWTSENMQAVARAGITHVVNLQQEFDDRTIAQGTGIEIRWIPCEDDWLPKLARFFWDGVRFTLEALKTPEARVLVHCAAGIHRGPMMLLAILRVLGHRPDSAMGMIAAARPQAAFPEVYVESVEDFIYEYHSDTNDDPDTPFRQSR